MKLNLIIFLIFLLSGCATYSISPQNITRYDKGIEILDSQEANSRVQVEVSQNEVGGFKKLPLIMYVGAQIIQGKDVLFDIDNLVATQNGVRIPILNYQQALDSQYSFAEALQDFSIFVPSPAVINNNFITPPFFYYGRGSFLTYNLFFNPFPLGSAQDLQIIQEQNQSRKVFSMNYLRKNTLSVEEKAKGGFIAIKSKYLKQGVLNLRILIGDETHLFNINIQKKQ